MEDSFYLISEANIFLDTLKKPESEKEIEKNLETLSYLRNRMVFLGFGSTLPEIVPAKNLEDVGSDFYKQVKIFRELVSLRRNTLNRVRVAIAAHKIAYNSLKRGRKYDFIDYLPFDGSYLNQIINFGEPAVRAYNRLMEILSNRGEPIYKVRMKDGTEKVIDPCSIENSMFSLGEEEIINIKREEQKPLVRRKSVRVAISAAYACMAAEKILSLGINLGMSKEHEEYSKILKNYGFSEDVRVDLLEGHEQLKEDLYSKGLLVYENENDRLTDEVLRSIKNRRDYINSNVTKLAVFSIASDVFHFLISEPLRIRSTLPLIPTMDTTPRADKFSFLNFVDVENPIEVVRKKMELESYGLNMKSELLAASIMFYYGKPIEWCSETFGVSLEEVKEGVKKISPFIKASGKAKEFVEYLRKDEKR